MRIFVPLLLILLLTACGDEPQSGQADALPAAPLPAQLCAQYRKALEELGTKSAIDYDEKGEATVPQLAWMQMDGGRHSQFAQMLAVHAACTKPDGSAERHVLIRDEYGRILMEAMVPTRIDIGSLPED